jgi:hypothetical protein
MARTPAAGHGDTELITDAKSGAEVEAALRPYEKFVKSLRLQAEYNTADRSFNVSAQMMDSILNADTEEDMWDADESGLLAGRDLGDVWQEIRGYEVVKSSRDDIEGGFGVYYIVDAKNLHTGEDFMWETGAPGIITKLAWLRSRGKFPVRCMIKSIPVGNGRAVLKLRPLPALAVEPVAATA